MARPIKSLELHCPMIQFLIIIDINFDLFRDFFIFDSWYYMNIMNQIGLIST